MSLESILSHILNEAKAEKDKIIRTAEQEAQKIINKANLEAETLRAEALERERLSAASQKQKIIVSARLEHKKGLLAAKKALIDSVFEKLKSQLNKDRFKKQQISSAGVRETEEDADFLLDRLRLDYETEIAKIIFK